MIIIMIPKGGLRSTYLNKPWNGSWKKFVHITFRRRKRLIYFRELPLLVSPKAIGRTYGEISIMDSDSIYEILSDCIMYEVK